MQTHVPAQADQAKQQQTKTVQQPTQLAGEQQSAFVDNRPEMAEGLQLRQLMDNSRQALEGRALQAMMNNSAQGREGRALQAMMNNSTLAREAQAFQLMLNSSARANPPVQRAEEEEPLQAKATSEHTAQLETAAEAPKPNNTGLPDNLKSGIESLSGMSMDHVKVHYNSSQPAQLNAHAYAQGNEIHVAPGQEQHVPHEAWHVVQQAQGRVKPTVQMKGGVPVNDDVGLEAEADVMGAKAIQLHPEENTQVVGDGAYETTHTSASRGSTSREGTAIQRRVSNSKWNALLASHIDSSITKRIKEIVCEAKKSELVTEYNNIKAHKETEQATDDEVEKMLVDWMTDVRTAVATSDDYLESVKQMKEALNGNGISLQAKKNFEERLEKEEESFPKKMWSDFEQESTNSHSLFGKLVEKLAEYHPTLLAHKKAIANAAAAAANQKQAAAAAAKQAIINFVATHNPTQVFLKYYNDMVASTTTTGAKRAGGTDPETGIPEDGVATYSRTYTFDLDPKVGEVHIHWRPAGVNWKSKKAHFKKTGSEGALGAQNQFNLTKSQMDALGITAISPEKLVEPY